MLFLTDVNHVSSGKAKETRQINLPSATASLQVVIGLCKRKETAALKFKAAASYRRVDRTAVRRLFSFAVVRQFNLLLMSCVCFFLCKLAGLNRIRNCLVQFFSC